MTGLDYDGTAFIPNLLKISELGQSLNGLKYMHAS